MSNKGFDYNCHVSVHILWILLFVSYVEVRAQA